ncbi:non-specific lipid transfer protein GPI-anchored 5 [Oryza sativa Japonica Group]|uniref:Protease inhibitor-like protein n=2 Tax=Oryza TaxID=4527 RepID=Q8H581_ORYSJ|nr:non-specific lipid transfer protein GPI-anchored 2 [Oryza sativa Japonica Group]BAC24853.1 protease inhibitor-like protein [Oryza sativa Japonica Group]BAD30796.1 protease inhibitor-like protein [Oryza sativa Japonica Group]
MAVARGVALAVVLAAAAAILAASPVAAQGGGGGGGSGSCMTEIISLASCLGYMSGNSSAPKPSCCTALSSVVTSKPACLCAVLGGGASSLGVTINNTRALELPAACNVKTPPASQCSTVGVPMPSPATPATPAAPAVPSETPAGTGGSKATPTTATTTTGQSASGGSVGKAASMATVVVSVAFALIHV